MHLQLRTVFALAVVPGAIGVALLAFALKEEPHVPKAAGGGAVATLSHEFWRAISAIALFSLANSSDAFLILQAYAAGVTTATLPLLWSAHHVSKALFSTPPSPTPARSLPTPRCRSRRRSPRSSIDEGQVPRVRRPRPALDETPWLICARRRSRAGTEGIVHQGSHDAVPVLRSVVIENY